MNLNFWFVRMKKRAARSVNLKSWRSYSVQQQGMFLPAVACQFQDRPVPPPMHRRAGLVAVDFNNLKTHRTNSRPVLLVRTSSPALLQQGWYYAAIDLRRIAIR